MEKFNKENKEEVKANEVVQFEPEKVENKVQNLEYVNSENDDDVFGSDEDDEFVEMEGKLVYELKSPITYGGEEIKVLTFDFENMTGGTLKKILMEVRSKLGKRAGQELVVPEVSKDYQCGVAAKACGLDIDVMYKLKARDYTAITMRVSNFLLGAK